MTANIILIAFSWACCSAFIVCGSRVGLAGKASVAVMVGGAAIITGLAVLA